MLVALYIGDHAGDSLGVRIGWQLTRLVQKGALDRVTHVEAILDTNTDGTVTIASSSLRDGGVRTRRGVRLNAAHWRVVDVPEWEVGISYQAGEIAARVNGGTERVSSGAMPAVIDTEGLLTTPWNGGSSYPAAHMHVRKYKPVPGRGDLYALTV